MQQIIARLEKAGLRIPEPELKRVPSGFDGDLEQAPLLRHKSLTAWCDHPGGPTDASGPDFIGVCKKQFNQVKPLMDWCLDGN